MKTLDKKTALRLTAILGGLAVALGAFGAHGLEQILTQHGRIEAWNTAAHYHLIHAVVLLVLLSMKTWRPRTWISMATGILIFSGSLYLLCLTQIGWLGAITPIGGLFLLGGWISLAFSPRDGN